MNTPQSFGNEGKFVIRYRPCPGEYKHSPDNKVATCPLVVDNNVIGEPDEACYLPTRLFTLRNRRKRIADTANLLFPKEAEGLTNREIFETILKANQLEEAFLPGFLYLPNIRLTMKSGTGIHSLSRKPPAATRSVST